MHPGGVAVKSVRLLSVREATLASADDAAPRPASRVDKRILSCILVEVPLERINLNVPSEMRRRLRAVAKRLKKTESEVARDLLVEALRRSEKEDFYRRVSEQMTPELRARLIEIAEAFERVDG